MDGWMQAAIHAMLKAVLFYDAYQLTCRHESKSGRMRTVDLVKRDGIGHGQGLGVCHSQRVDPPKVLGAPHALHYLN